VVKYNKGSIEGEVMPLKKNELLESLDKLRDQIREEQTLLTTKTPIVCSDLTLKEIAKNKPLKISDFLAIPGINQKFIDEYASRFLKEILKKQTDSVKEVKVSKFAYKVLDHYKDRLTDISKRNPNLYMGRIEKNRSFDLTRLEMNDSIINFLTNPKVTSLKVAFDSNQNKELLHKDITTLYREINKEEKETGAYDLYIAYPYIEGVFKKDQFAIKAPLLYFPVKLLRSKRDFTIKKDNSKDIIYNRDLLLAFSKLENSDIDSQTLNIDTFHFKVLNDTVIPFYLKNGIQIKNHQLKFHFEPFKNELKEDFVKKRKASFEIKETITLGRYKLYSSMIQKDMNQILATSKYNELLEGLIDDHHLFAKEETFFQVDASDAINEERLSYINELNYAQEKVIDLVNSEQKLVILGPPGTGKSQTITSLIASSVLRGENVLIVSEKKVALDVIYSRLKDASRYAMFIDDAENKQSFYQKLSAFLEPIQPKRTLNNDIYKLEEEIKNMIETLDHSLNLLYHESIQEIPVHKLYNRYIKDKDIINNLSPIKVHEMFESVFHNLNFKELQQIEDTFDKDNALKEYLNYQYILENYPLITKLETKISRSNRIEFEAIHKAYEVLQENIKKVWFFKRIKLKKDFINNHKQRILFLTKKKSNAIMYLKLLVKNKTLHTYILDNIVKLNKIVAKYEKLTVNERKFLSMLLNHNLVKDVDNVASYRKYIFDAYYTGYLETFKTKNQKYLYIIDVYAKKMDELNELINQKMNITTESFEMELYKNALNLLNSKRNMDIKRILESAHKPSIKTFIDIFQLELMNSIRIWMMTPEVVSAIMPLVYGMFDLVIFDEASQMYVEKGIPAIYRAKKVVIAGDTKQLRPSSLGIGRLQDEDDLYEDEILKDVQIDAKSLLDLARYKYKETLLNYHYRSIYEELIAFSNHAFYDAKLIVSPNQVKSEKPPIEYVYVKNAIFENRSNIEEAKEVIKLIKKIFKERKQNETIGVITFNRAQRDIIENYIDDELFKKSAYQKMFENELFRNDLGEDTSLFVKNIENVQGDERDIIIFSMGYARDKQGYIRRRFGWLNHDGGQNRLNVAITRAKRKIYFISSLYPEELKVDDLTGLGPKLLKDYMRYCYYVSNQNDEMTKEVLNKLYKKESRSSQTHFSQMTLDVKTKLEKLGYHIKTSIGIGSYQINLAIYDEVNNKYNLGIICAHDDMEDVNARRDFLHQEKYLNSRKWLIYRIFESNWYTNPNKEIKNIKEMLKQSKLLETKESLH
jgi:predicted HD phosphohydrolase